MIRRALNTIVALSFLAAPGVAQVERATVSVEGMSCPFCAFGVEKRLRRVEGVASVEVALKEGTATVAAAEDGSIDVAGIPGAVRKAGFTPGTIEIVARGTISGETPEDGPARTVLRVGEGEQEFLLVNLSEEQRRAIEELARTGSRVRVAGEVHFHEGQPSGLEPTKIEKVG